MPIHKNTFQSCNFGKNLSRKNIYNGSEQRFDKKFKPVFESQKCSS